MKTLREMMDLIDKESCEDMNEEEEVNEESEEDSFEIAKRKIENLQSY
jgi:hypothetical protein